MLYVLAHWQAYWLIRIPVKCLSLYSAVVNASAKGNEPIPRIYSCIYCGSLPSHPASIPDSFCWAFIPERKSVETNENILMQNSTWQVIRSFLVCFDSWEWTRIAFFPLEDKDTLQHKFSNHTLWYEPLFTEGCLDARTLYFHFLTSVASQNPWSKKLKAAAVINSKVVWTQPIQSCGSRRD